MPLLWLPDAHSPFTVLPLCNIVVIVLGWLAVAVQRSELTMGAKPACYRGFSVWQPACSLPHLHDITFPDAINFPVPLPDMCHPHALPTRPFTAQMLFRNLAVQRRKKKKKIFRRLLPSRARLSPDFSPEIPPSHPLREELCSSRYLETTSVAEKVLP